MSWLKALGKGLLNVATGGIGGTVMDAIGGAGAGLGAASQSKANNRGTKFEGQTDLARLLMDRDQQYQSMNVQREQEGRAGASDAWRKLLSAQHVLSPAAHSSLSPYTAAARMPTGAEQTGADALTQQVLARLQGGNPIAAMAPRQITANDAAFRVDPRLLDAGKGESTMGWLGALFGGLSAANARRTQDERA